MPRRYRSAPRCLLLQGLSLGLSFRLELLGLRFSLCPGKKAMGLSFRLERLGLRFSRRLYPSCFGLRCAYRGVTLGVQPSR